MAEWLNITFKGMDSFAFSCVSGLEKIAGGFFTPFFEFITIFGNGGIFFLVLGAVLLLFKKTRMSGFCVLLAIGVGSLFTNLILKPSVARPRPYTFEEFRQIWLNVGGHIQSEFSFPSGHTTVATTSMTALFLSTNRKKSFWLLIIPILMGLSRIYLVAHYLSDVIGGLIVGGIAGAIGYYLIKLVFDILERNSQNKGIYAFLNFDIIEIFRKRK